MDQRKNTENGFNENGFNTVEEALEDLRQGKLILVTDDPDRENEGDFICAAEFATTENINFMAVHGKGLICMPMSEAYVEKLQLPQMVTKNTDNHETAFTVSIDCVDTTTGISAAERSITAMRCVAEDAKPEDFRRPGHMFPLLAKKNGVLERNGHTEATVDLCRLAGLKECGLCCEIMKEDGTMMRTPQLKELAKEWNIKFITIKDLQEYRKVHEQLVERVQQVFPKIRVHTHCIVNHYFGDHITVTGLLTGRDIVEQLRAQERGDKLLLPENLLRDGRDVLLDDMSIQEIEEALQMPVDIVKSSGRDFIDKIIGETL